MLNKKPRSWSDINVSQYKEIFKLKRDDFEEEDEYNIHLLSIVTDTSIEEIEEIDFDDYQFLLSSISFVYYPPTRPCKEVIQTSAGPLYYLKDYNTISIGEFIDLENLFTNNIIDNLSTIFSIVYRVKDIKNSLLFLDTFEPYGDWIFHRSPLFDGISINEVYGIINDYIAFRSAFYENYEGLFDGTPSDDGEETYDENQSVLSRAENAKEEQRQKSLHKWGWDLFLYKLTKNDPTKMEEVTKMPLIQAMNILSMKKELGLPD